MSTALQPPARPDRDAATTPDAIMELGFAWWGSKTLLSAVELGVFAELASAGPLNAEELRGRLGLHPRGARDFFDALVALGMLEREERRYRNTPAADAFLDPSKPGYVGDFLAMAGNRPSWHSLNEGLRTGRPQNETTSGDDFFEGVYSDPEQLRGFLRAMTANSAGTARALAAEFPWERYRTVIDIGCAEGGVPVQLALTHEHLRGGGFDLPVVGPLFDEFVGTPAWPIA